MSAYVIASVNVTDPEKYKNYMALSPIAIDAAGGKFIVRGGNPKILEGEWLRPRVVIIEFPTREAAEGLLCRTVGEWSKTNPRLATWAEANLPEGLSVLAFPQAHQRLLRTTNGLERVNQEVKRRTRVCRHFPNEASCLRLVSAILMEISDEWATGKAYLTFAD